MAAAAQLYARAEALAATLPINASLTPPAVDVVVSGGGNWDAFYAGVHLVQMALYRRSQGAWLAPQRWRGDSAGGMYPFELALKGTNLTIQHHLAYGWLEQQFADDYQNDLEAGYLQDHHWRLMAAWMVNKWAAQLPTLDQRVFLALTCLVRLCLCVIRRRSNQWMTYITFNPPPPKDPLPKQVIVSNFTSQKQAASAFMATGTYVEIYDDMLCSDGGAESGPNMTPLFHDQKHPQLVVSLLHTGFPTEMVIK